MLRLMTEITLEAPAPTPVPAAPAATPEVVAAVDAIIKEARKRPATLAELKSKKRRVVSFDIHSLDEDGADVALTLKYQALSRTEYDELVAAYPPTPKQKSDGMIYNPETFAPALVAAVSVDPKLSIADVKDLMEDPSWSPGEIETLTGMAFGLCQQGAGIPFTVSV